MLVTWELVEWLNDLADAVNHIATHGSAFGPDPKLRHLTLDGGGNIAFAAADDEETPTEHEAERGA